MTQDEVIALAREAGGGLECYDISVSALERFADLAIAKYRADLLAGAGEPVAWLHPANAACVTTDPTAYARGIPLRTADQLAAAVLREREGRKPLTEAQIEIAWRHGWASCRDAEYVGKEAEDERWGSVCAEVAQATRARGNT